MMAAPYAPFGLGWAWRLTRRALLRAPFEAVGFAVAFVWEAFVSIPVTLHRYRAQTMRMITDMTWGRGSVIVGGGTVPVLMILGLAIGGGVGIQGYMALNLVGLGPMTGVVSAFANTRELAPIAAAVGFAAQAGCRMTAEIGSMRISEEIDALESLGLRSIPFVVTTRVLAGAITVVPTFLVTLLLSYFSCAAVVLVVHGQSSGIYDHYFYQFVNLHDIIAATVKMLVFSVVVILIHCYQGFFATGGPEGVGVASGRAVRASFIAIITLDMLLTIVLWGINSSITFSG
ncbi:ABC transporter permease [Nocardia yunnanensis]|uniref:ABC transporter permease n=1 Tax=Nocardia yunnanensis TaxID=2382165 RepID=A0A386ZKH8_9NOCA|nr:ABC transporter permease [Nocardia yunnanensis]AYF77956.1 ABC transporter permease [Nocardia yunnanensis]